MLDSAKVKYRKMKPFKVRIEKWLIISKTSLKLSKIVKFPLKLVLSF
jgi:hypothetical protein